MPDTTQVYKTAGCHTTNVPTVIPKDTSAVQDLTTQRTDSVKTTILPNVRKLQSNVTEIIRIHVSFARPKYRRNTVHNTSFGMLAVNIDDLSKYASSSYIERQQYDQLNFKMTFNIQNGTDLDQLAQSVVEKCAMAFENNKEFVSCQIINLDQMKKSSKPRTAVVSSMGQFNARFVQLIAMTVTSTFKHFRLELTQVYYSEE